MAVQSKINLIESKTSPSTDATQALLKSLVSVIGCEVIPFDQTPKQSVSIFMVRHPDGSVEEQEFKTRAQAVKALLQIDEVVEHCRSVLQLEKDGFMSEESELEWIEDNAENEAAEIGYKILENGESK